MDIAAEHQPVTKSLTFLSISVVYGDTYKHDAEI